MLITAPRVLNAPTPGFFKLRMVRNGPVLPARIYRACPMQPADDRYDPACWCLPLSTVPPLLAEIAGKPCEPDRIWEGAKGKQPSAAEWRLLSDQAEWDRRHAPEAPLANPVKPVNLAYAEIW